MEAVMNKKTKIGAVLAAVLAVPALAFAFGGPGHEGKGDPAKREARRAEMLQKYDANGDGALDENERNAAFEARAKERFAKLDSNGDGALSFDEFKAGKKMMRGFHRHHRDGGDAHKTPEPPKQ
jgi:Ca2+-binding EF-hand superfamily protein